MGIIRPTARIHNRLNFPINLVAEDQSGKGPIRRTIEPEKFKDLDYKDGFYPDGVRITYKVYPRNANGSSCSIAEILPIDIFKNAHITIQNDDDGRTKIEYEPRGRSAGFLLIKDLVINMLGWAKDYVYNVRAIWKDPELVKCFLDLCLKEVNRVGIEGDSLKKDSWKKIEETLAEEKDVKLNERQLKNQWKYLKKKYMLWSNLVISATGNGYDPGTNTVNWNAQRWDEYIKRVPKARQFRNGGLQYGSEMKLLFDGLTATRGVGHFSSMEATPANDA